ncbi:MAG TPA: insulinase family protein [Chitinophagaceae bacterium]|nr:insulinase family protein [Chitinophagaceae bacterium]
MKRRFLTLVMWLFLICFQLSAQVNFSEPLPLDPKVKTGKLENGLTYYIRQNKKPEQKVELRLVVNAGSINEDDDQQGLAHMAEHMAFNGTKNFKKNEIISFLQDIGVGFGNDLNAYTSFDQTVYILPIPTSKPGNLEKGFQVLEDWAHNVTYVDEDIDGERAIILEESRLGKGANDRMFRKIYPGLFAGSKYGNRLPIGVDSIIKNFKHDAIRRYYRDWYRPDLMAVIVVGDIEPTKAEEMIRKHFSKLTSPANPRKRENAELPAYKSSDAIVVTDKEATSYSFGIYYPAYKEDPSVTLGDYRDDLKQQLFITMMNQRLQELTQKENPPFLFASTSFSSFARGYEGFNAFGGVGTGDISKGMNALAEEIERVKRFGFTAGELERAKKNMLAFYEREYNNRDKTESANFVDEYINHFLEQEPSPGIEKEFEFVKAIMPGITLEEVNAVSKKFKDQENRFVFAVGPDPKPNEKLPESKDLLAILDAKAKADIKPYEEKVVQTNLLKSVPKAGSIVSKSKNDLLGTTELKLSNGVTVTLKPTDFKNDQILMGATRAGGKDNYGLADKYNAEYATAIVSAMGAGEFSPTDLKKALAGKTVTVSMMFSGSSEGVRGNSTVKDLESMLQLTYLYFTEPRKDTALFKSFVQRNKSQFAMLSANPQAAFIDTMYKTLYNNNPLAPVAVPKSEYYDKINLDRSLAIYRERFGDASGMNFVFVGSFKEEEIIPLIEKYIASLPATGKKFNYVDNKVRTVSGKKNLTVNKGKEQKSLILAFYAGEIPYSEDLDLKTQAMSEVLNIRIIEELREKIQGIYGGGTFASLEKIPYGNYNFVLQLPCGPEKVDTLVKSVKKEFEMLAKNGPSQEYLDKVKKQWLEDHKTQMKENNTWLDQLLTFKSQGGDPRRFLEYEKYVNALTTKDVQQAANLILNGKNQFFAVLMPEAPAVPNTIANRKVNVQQTIELSKPEFQVDIYDNGDIDGDSITVYFNGQVVVGKQRLTDKPISVKLKANPNSSNELVMYANNLGSIPPNTALMKVTAADKVYEIRLESDNDKSGAVVFKIKQP